MYELLQSNISYTIANLKLRAAEKCGCGHADMYSRCGAAFPQKLLICTFGSVSFKLWSCDCGHGKNMRVPPLIRSKRLFHFIQTHMGGSGTSKDIQAHIGGHQTHLQTFLLTKVELDTSVEIQTYIKEGSGLSVDIYTRIDGDYMHLQTSRLAQVGIRHICRLLDSQGQGYGTSVDIQTCIWGRGTALDI